MALCTVSAVRGPCIRTITPREATSMISWSHQSPKPFALSSASQCASFFPHKGPLLIGLDLAACQPPHRLIMNGAGVSSRHHGIASHGAAGMPGQACRAPNATALLQMGHDLLDLCGGQPGLRQRRALPLAERLATVPTTQQPNVLLLSHPLVYPQFAAFCQSLTLIRTGRIGTGKLADILFACSPGSPHALLTAQAPLVIQIPQAARQSWRMRSGLASLRSDTFLHESSPNPVLGRASRDRGGRERGQLENPRNSSAL